MTLEMLVLLALLMMMCLSDAALISNFDRFRRACPSPSVNAWKIRVGGSCYLITPAHVAIFVKEGKWAFSQFLDDFKDKDWRIHYSYTTNPSPQYDICWAKLDDDQPDALDLEHSVICDPTKVRVIFRQPYDMDAVWTLRGSEMGLTEAVIYRSPKLVVTAGDGNVPESEYCSLLESMDVGFRGMSGAIALDENDKCVGMFVKRGNLVPLKQPRTASTESVAAVVSVDIARESVIIPRESAIIATLPLSPSSWLEQLIFPSISANMARMDANMARMDANMARMDAKTDAQFRHLNDVVLKREDLSELGVVFDTRRGVFLPPANIQSIDNAESISVRAIIGSNAPEIPRF